MPDKQLKISAKIIELHYPVKVFLIIFEIKQKLLPQSGPGSLSQMPSPIQGYRDVRAIIQRALPVAAATAPLGH